MTHYDIMKFKNGWITVLPVTNIAIRCFIVLVVYQIKKKYYSTKIEPVTAFLVIQYFTTALLSAESLEHKHTLLLDDPRRSIDKVASSICSY